MESGIGKSFKVAVAVFREHCPLCTVPFLVISGANRKHARPQF